jgi:hypothetical protein
MKQPKNEIFYFSKDLNQQKNLKFETCMSVLNNVAIFVECLPIEGQSQQWLLVFQELEVLFRHLESIMKKSWDYTCFFVIMTQILKVPYVSNSKVILRFRANTFVFEISIIFSKTNLI